MVSGLYAQWYCDCQLLYEKLSHFLYIFPTEPGYYEDGAFGIRIENVVVVKEIETKHNFAGKKYLTMEPVTMVGHPQ